MAEILSAFPKRKIEPIANFGTEIGLSFHNRESMYESIQALLLKTTCYKVVDSPWLVTETETDSETKADATDDQCADKPETDVAFRFRDTFTALA